MLEWAKKTIEDVRYKAFKADIIEKAKDAGPIIAYPLAMFIETELDGAFERGGIQGAQEAVDRFFERFKERVKTLPAILERLGKDASHEDRAAAMEAHLTGMGLKQVSVGFGDQRFSVVTTEVQEEGLKRRQEFVEQYCADKGWDVTKLTMDQVLEIRSQTGWQKAI